MASSAVGTGGAGPQVHGRFATQLAGAYSDGPGWTLLQPSVLMRLDVGGLLGEDLSFTMFGRTYRDFSQSSSGPGYGGETMVRMYDMSIRYGASGGWLGMGLGRLVSYYVGGLGAFDGGELTVRMGGISAGLIGGGQPDYRTSSVDPDRRKFAAYVNWRLGTDALARNDVTLAYGRQYFRGTLDRDFFYVQASLTPAPGLYLYQSAEIDLHELEGGESVAKTHLTSTFLTLSWMPTSWLSASAGYDATRPIIYLESMKTFPDTLLRRDLQQGVRLSGHVRLPARVTLSVNTGLRMKTGDAREALSYGGGVRIADIASMGLAAGLQYRRARALYSEGDDFTLNLEQWIARRMTVALTYNRYAYTLVGQETGAVATTLSAAFSTQAHQFLVRHGQSGQDLGSRSGFLPDARGAGLSLLGDSRESRHISNNRYRARRCEHHGVAVLQPGQEKGEEGSPDAPGAQAHGDGRGRNHASALRCPWRVSGAGPASPPVLRVMSSPSLVEKQPGPRLKMCGSRPLCRSLSGRGHLHGNGAARKECKSPRAG